MMGYASLKELTKHLDKFNVRLLARKSKKNIKKLAPFLKKDGISVEWGDLLNYEDVVKAMGKADIVLHLGALVSPEADKHPELALKINVGGTQNIVDAVKNLPNPDKVRLVYIGSVAETAHRDEPVHWSRIGDPVITGVYDYYGVSKIKAERVVAESGLKYWVCLRQSGILHPGLMMKTDDPIMFHVPLRGVLEWTTVEDSARLMAGVCSPDIPETFWRGFYNIGSGEQYRLTNYQFEKLILKMAGCPAPEKVFEPSWFAVRNFHGSWFSDSDRLENIVPFRENLSLEDYFLRMKKELPWWFSLAPLAPAWVIKLWMKKVAYTSGAGTLDWLHREDMEDKIKVYFGSRERQKTIPGWKEFDFTPPSSEPVNLDHGYDENKPLSQLTIDDMRNAAEFRGGKCLSKDMKIGEIDSLLEWECAFGHKFRATPRIVLLGGHWCPECLPSPWRYQEEAARNPFMAQVWYAGHTPDEITTALE